MTVWRPPLASLIKFDPGEARDAQGRWTGGAPSMRSLSLREASPGPQRSLTRGESRQRIGAKLPNLPAGYTGSTQRENPVDGWKTLNLTMQRPKALTPAQHAAVFATARHVIAQEREGAIAKGRVTKRQVTTIANYNATHRRIGEFNIPADVPDDVAHRAYNYAALRALHLFGVVNMARDYRLSDTQRAEFEPVQPFIRSATGRLLQEMKARPGMKAAHQTYVKEFGAPFADGRSIGQSVLRSRRAGIPLGSTGPPKLRFSSVQQIIKRAPPDIEAAAAVATKPSPAQSEAGYYRKGHVSFGGLDVAIENAKGSVREGGAPGYRWSVTMPAHYGYVKRTEGADGDHVDVHLGPHAHDAQKLPVFVVNQVNVGTGQFDEHKAMLGFRTVGHAQRIYDAAFSDGKGPRRRKAITRMSFPAFKRWVTNGDTTKPLQEAA